MRVDITEMECDFTNGHVRILQHQFGLPDSSRQEVLIYGEASFFLEQTVELLVGHRQLPAEAFRIERARQLIQILLDVQHLIGQLQVPAF